MRARRRQAGQNDAGQRGRQRDMHRVFGRNALRRQQPHQTRDDHQAAAEAHPAEVMDMTFSTQALIVEHLVASRGALPAGLHPVPRKIDDRVAREKLRALGVEAEELTEAQLAYLGSWRSGT